MATKPGILTDFPWQRLGSFKYALYVPFIVKAIHTNFFGGYELDNWSLHIVLVSALRYLHGQIWMSVTRLRGVVDKHQIQLRGMKFDQLDRESNWEDYILLDCLMLCGFHECTNYFNHFPAWNWAGFVYAFFYHIGPTEFIYYWFHRLLHHHYLYTRYHSHHHSSFLTEAVTGNVHPFAEHIAYALLFGSLYISASLLGIFSIGLLYVYTVVFDFLNCIGHCNWEFMPEWMFRAFPPLKYLLYTPSFHSLHHTQVHTNFCLYVPLYDYLYSTVDKNSDSLYLTARKGRPDETDCVYLTHGSDVLSIFHFPFGIPHFASTPYERKWYIWLLLPIALPIMLTLWILRQPFKVDKHKLDNLRSETWAVPRFNFQYNLASERPTINTIIEKSILAAEEKGAKVISLGMHNKDTLLNTSGAIFVKSLENLKIRITDGSALNAAIVVNRITAKASKIYVTGLEDKISRIVAVYLCKKGFQVLVKDPSAVLYAELKKACDAGNVTRIYSVQEAEGCTDWIIDGEMGTMDQKFASKGTHFHPISSDIVQHARKDCVYEPLPALEVPSNFENFLACEGKMPRRVVHASHAAGIIHALEEWRHHEVGSSIDIDRVDLVWEAAKKHGFAPFTSSQHLKEI